MIEYRNLRVAVLGGGSVGSQVAGLLLEHGGELAARAGAGLELVGVAVRDPDAPRDTEIPRHLLTTDAEALILGADIVVELIGGIEPARTYILQALSSGADVITANKAVLGDVVSAARRHVAGGPGVAESTHANLPVLPVASATTRYQVTLQVADEPGVLATIARLFADHHVSVEAVSQSVPAGQDTAHPTATLVIVTHEAIESSLAATVDALAASPVVSRVASVLRVEG